MQRNFLPKEDKNSQPLQEFAFMDSVINEAIGQLFDRLFLVKKAPNKSNKIQF